MQLIHKKYIFFLISVGSVIPLYSRETSLENFFKQETDINSNENLSVDDGIDNDNDNNIVSNENPDTENITTASDTVNNTVNESSTVNDSPITSNEDTINPKNANISIDSGISIDEIDVQNSNNNQEDTKEEKDYKYQRWNNFLYPWKDTSDDSAVYLNFNDTELINVLKYFESIYQVIFITDDVIQPLPQGGRSILGTKVNITTHQPLSREQAWNVFITLLENSGVTLQPGSMKGVYRVAPLAKESPLNYSRGPLPFFMDIDPEELPNSDMRIRYIYQAKNTSLQAISTIAKTMQSPSSPDPIELPEIYSVMLTDRSYNIKTILAIIKEIDQVTNPETMIIIKLKKTDVSKIVELYQMIIKDDKPNPSQAPSRVLGPKRSDTLSFFDPSVKLIPDIYTNTLIALGTEESLKKVKKFVDECEQRDGKVPYMPTRVYKLKYIQAASVVKILEQVLAFKENTEASKSGGVRGGVKFLSHVNLVAEETTNSIIISAPENEYMYIKDAIEQLDIQQPQIGLDVMIVSVEITKSRNLGTQIRNKEGALGNNINAQTGVLNGNVGVIANYPTDSSGTLLNGASRLLGNLMTLVTGSSTASGTSVVTLGSDTNGTWGLIKFIQNELEGKILNNPFLITTNNYEAFIKVGESRRIAATAITNSVKETQSFQSDEAKTQVKITPTVNSEGSITLQIFIESSVFTGDSNDPVSAGNKSIRSIFTSALVPDGEMIVLGGLIYESVNEVVREVPFLSRIPIIGWLFKNKEQEKIKTAILIFIQPKIMRTNSDNNILNKLDQLQKFSIKSSPVNYCPINRWYFGDREDSQYGLNSLEDFMDKKRTGFLDIKRKRTL